MIEQLETRFVPSALPNTVYVDSHWAGTVASADPSNDPVGGLQFGTNAFSDIQSAIEAAPSNGTVVVFGGTYSGALNIDKSLQAIELSTNTSYGINAVTAVTISGAVTLSNDATFTEVGVAGGAAASLTFGSTVDSATASHHTLIVNSAVAVTFNGTVGGTTALAMLDTAGGGTTFLYASVTTTADQTYEPLVLGAAATLTSTGNGNISFLNRVDGAYSLIVSTGGTTTFDGTVGGSTALAMLDTAGPGTTVLNGSVTTTGSQTYEPLVLDAAATLTSTGGGNISLLNHVSGNFALGVVTTGTATFDGPVTVAFRSLEQR
jgi:hypothetical protein